jgi:hypothetical protein
MSDQAVIFTCHTLVPIFSPSPGVCLPVTVLANEAEEVADWKLWVVRDVEFLQELVWIKPKRANFNTHGCSGAGCCIPVSLAQKNMKMDRSCRGR